MSGSSPTCYHPTMRPSLHLRLLGAFAAAGALSACNPAFNWREYHDADAGYSVLFPGKPSRMTRTIELNGAKLDMTMTAADVDGVSFAVGNAEVADAAKADAALRAMKTALVTNIGATVQREGAASSASAAGAASRRGASIDI
jgi:hypothetical protein